MTDAPEGPAEGEPERGARRPRVGDGGSPVGSTLSIVLAVVAVIAGFLILRAITDDDNDGGAITPDPAGTASPDSTPGTGTTGSGGSADPGVTTTVAAPVATKTGATVLVANASGISGSAGSMATALQTDGYTVGEPTNSTGEQLATSIVYYVDGNPQALAVATTLAGQITGVQALPMPVPPPIEAALGDATVVLMLGTDAAGKTLADVAPAAGAVAPPAAVGVTTTTVAG